MAFVSQRREIHEIKLASVPRLLSIPILALIDLPRPQAKGENPRRWNVPGTMVWRGLPRDCRKTDSNRKGPGVVVEHAPFGHAAAKGQRMDPDAWKTCQYDRPERLEISSPRSDRQSIE